MIFLKHKLSCVSTFTPLKSFNSSPNCEIEVFIQELPTKIQGLCYSLVIQKDIRRVLDLKGHSDPPHIPFDFWIYYLPLRVIHSISHVNQFSPLLQTLVNFATVPITLTSTK